MVAVVPRALLGTPCGAACRTYRWDWRPTLLHVTVRRYRCPGCAHVWRQNTAAAAAPRSKLSRSAVLWALKAVVVDRLSIARVADSLGAWWHTDNDAVLDAGRQLLINDPSRLEGVRVLGVDEHCWRHTRHGAKFDTVIMDLTPVSDRSGPARLLDMVPGRSKAVFTTWLQAQSSAFRAGIETVAMDGFTGDKPAAAEALPDAVTVMDPFHVVALAGDALDRCRQRLQQETCRHRGRTGDPPYGIRRVLRTGAGLLTDGQHERLTAVFADEAHAQVEATWGIHQNIVDAHRDPDHGAAKNALATVIDAISTGVPTPLTELITLGQTLHRRAGDILTYVDRPGTSNGPTKAINALPRASPRHRTRLHPTPPTTSPNHCSTPAALDPDSTPFCEQPQNRGPRKPGPYRGLCHGQGHSAPLMIRGLDVGQAQTRPNARCTYDATATRGRSSCER